MTFGVIGVPTPTSERVDSSEFIQRDDSAVSTAVGNI